MTEKAIILRSHEVVMTKDELQKVTNLRNDIDWYDKKCQEYNREVRRLTKANKELREDLELAKEEIRILQWEKT